MVEYKDKYRHMYNSFAQVERCEAIEEILKKKIDFEYFTQAGIIQAHFHLHKRVNLEQIQASYDEFGSKLERSICLFDDSFLKYAQPLNLIKGYLGEKWAFEYAFLVHYNSFLFIASIVGGLCFVAQLVLSGTHEWHQGLDLDTQANPFYSFAICIWAIVFVESWKRK